MRGLASAGVQAWNSDKIATSMIPYADAVSAPHGESLMLTLIDWNTKITTVETVVFFRVSFKVFRL